MCTNTVVLLWVPKSILDWICIILSPDYWKDSRKEEDPCRKLKLLAFLKSGYHRGNERKILSIEPLLKDLVWGLERPFSYLSQAIKRQFV